MPANVLRQALKQLRVESGRVGIVDRYRKNVVIEACNHVHRTQREQDRVGNRLQGARTQLAVMRANLDQSQAHAAAAGIDVLEQGFNVQLELCPIGQIGFRVQQAVLLDAQKLAAESAHALA